MAKRQGKVPSIAEAVGLIRDGDVVAFGGGALDGRPMALVREIARQRRSGLTVVGWNGGMELDILAGAGCIAAIEIAGLGRAHPASMPNVRRRQADGALEVLEVPESVALDRFRAGAAGLPFMPVSLPGDLSSTNRIVAAVDDPFSGARSVVVRAVTPDVVLLHAYAADEHGNVRIARGRLDEVSPDGVIARAARTVIVSVEQIVSDEAISHSRDGAILPAAQITAVVEAPYGAHPYGLPGRYSADLDQVDRYEDAAKTAQGLSRWLHGEASDILDHDDYLEFVGARRLMEISTSRAVR